MVLTSLAQEMIPPENPSHFEILPQNVTASRMVKSCPRQIFVPRPVYLEKIGCVDNGCVGKGVVSQWTVSVLVVLVRIVSLKAVSVRIVLNCC